MNVVITGASKGIGKAIAESFAADGATLFLCARNNDTLQQAAIEIKERYPATTIHTKAVDMSITTAAKDFGHWCLQYGIPDILINNAGHFLPGDISIEEEGNLEKMMAVNLYSAYHLTRTLLSRMKDESGKANRHIFNIGSVAGLHAYQNGGAYSISKFALSGFSKNLREEMRPFHIKVTTVSPGAVMTDSWGEFDNSKGRIMEAADIATIIVACSKLSPQAVVEDIVLRPQLGDL